MRKFSTVIIALFLCLSFLTNAWGQIFAVQKIPDEALQFNESVLQDILKRDVEAVLGKALPAFQQLENVESEIAKYMGYLPAYEEGKKYVPFISEVRITEDLNPPETIYRTRYELTDLNVKELTKDAWATVDIYSQETAEGLKFRHFSFNPVLHQPTEVGKFEIKDKSIRHYVFLVLLIGMPIFIIVTIIAIIRNKHLTKKWIWGIFLCGWFVGCTV